MPLVWTFFFIRDAPHTNPTKDKYVLIVCQDSECHGFFVNSNIGQFIQKRPTLLASQVLIKAEDYSFLHHDSYIDCSQLFAFEDDHLGYGCGSVNENTKAAIKNAVGIAPTIDQKYQEIIALM